MRASAEKENMMELAGKLNLAEKIERSLGLLEEVYGEFGEGAVISNSLGKDSTVVWHLAKKVNPDARGFIVTTRFKPILTKEFMKRVVGEFPELRIYENNAPVPEKLYETDPAECCRILKVEPLERALREMDAACWITGLRCTEGHTRRDFAERETREDGLEKLNPILLWHEREVWQYLAMEGVPVNPAYEKGYRSLGCEPCTTITTGPYERDGRWADTGKCGGECGLHSEK